VKYETPSVTAHVVARRPGAASRARRLSHARGERPWPRVNRRGAREIFDRAARDATARDGARARGARRGTTRRDRGLGLRSRDVDAEGTRATRARGRTRRRTIEGYRARVRERRKGGERARARRLGADDGDDGRARAL